MWWSCDEKTTVLLHGACQLSFPATFYYSPSVLLPNWAVRWVYVGWLVDQASWITPCHWSQNTFASAATSWRLLLEDTLSHTVSSPSSFSKLSKRHLFLPNLSLLCVRWSCRSNQSRNKPMCLSVTLLCSFHSAIGYITSSSVLYRWFQGEADYCQNLQPTTVVPLLLCDQPADPQDGLVLSPVRSCLSCCSSWPSSDPTAWMWTSRTFTCQWRWGRAARRHRT